MSTTLDRPNRALASPAEAYNYRHFRPRHLLHDVLATFKATGIAPGSPAPDFELTKADGGRLRLSELHGVPVLLRFGSFT